jgi:hypothetical protein
MNCASSLFALFVFGKNLANNKLSVFSLSEMDSEESLDKSASQENGIICGNSVENVVKKVVKSTPEPKVSNL